MNAREACLKTLQQLLQRGKSLSSLVGATKPQVLPNDQALYQALVYGTLREYRALHKITSAMLRHPFLPENNISIILNMGAYQLLRLQIGDHGIINETVNLMNKIAPRQKNLCNAILRNIQRQREELIPQLKTLEIENLPTWLRRDYPELAAINAQIPPFTFRVNGNREELLTRYQDAVANPIHPQAITFYRNNLNPIDVKEFNEGLISVQDASAQHAATILKPQKNEHILDACAAPGGKTCHILELEPTVRMQALDSDSARLKRVQENLERLGLKAKLITADARETNKWWDKKEFDAVLLDAPCSGSGVLRRHPDIAFLRTQQDLQQLPKTQMELLNALWKILARGGRLLYTTCSILPQENQQNIERFLREHSDAKCEPLNLEHCKNGKFGSVHFPDEMSDGFFYALLRKK